MLSPITLSTPCIDVRRKLAYITGITFWIAIPFIIYDLKITRSEDRTLISAIFGFNLTILGICILRILQWTTQHIIYNTYDIILIFFVYLLLLATCILINYLQHLYIALTVFFLYCTYVITYTTTMGFVIYDLYKQYKYKQNSNQVINIQEVSIPIGPISAESVPVEQILSE